MNRVLYIFLFITILLFAVSCAGVVAPSVNMYSLQDENYPCIQIDFTDQVRYDDYKKTSKDDNIALIYKLSMRGYKIEVIKLYALEKPFNQDDLPTLNQTSSKIYEVASDDYGDKSAIITIEDMKEGIFLKGSVAYFIQPGRAVRVDIYRVIRQKGTFIAGGMDSWLTSAIGKRSVENMKEIVNRVMSTITTRECTLRKDINTKWW